MTDLTRYESCSAKFPPDTEIDKLLGCLSDGQDAALVDLATGVNAFFLIFAGALVFFMQIGFAMLCAGSIRAKNVKNVILWNMLDSAGGGLAYWSIGYAFTFGSDDDGGWTFVGTKGFFLQGPVDIRMEFWLYQWAFACAVSSIVAGTVAERLQMAAYLSYSFFLVGFAYPVLAHAFWSTNGFMSPFGTDSLLNSGAIDFAGSGPVHMCGGVAALVCALILGPRIGRFHDRDGNPLEVPNDFAPHSVTLQMLGTFCLWFGWYGFNPGSILYITSATNGAVSALAAVNTTLAACSGAVCALLSGTVIDYVLLGYHTYDLTYAMNGCLTALAAVTSGCSVYDTWGGVITGCVAGWIYIGASKLMVKLRIDDAVDAVPVHMFGGAWGLIATGLFAKKDLLEAAYGQSTYYGAFMGGGGTLLACQLIGIIFIFSWTFCIMGAFFFALNTLGYLRVDPLEEEVGLDISRHKGACYDNAGIPEEQAVMDLHNSRHGMTEDLSRGRTQKAEDSSDDNNAAVKEENA